jgi:hypothetical protein
VLCEKIAQLTTAVFATFFLICFVGLVKKFLLVFYEIKGDTHCHIGIQGMGADKHSLLHVHGTLGS